MAANDYRQQYSRGPPPQQQYSWAPPAQQQYEGDQYNQMPQQQAPRQNVVYNQEAHIQNGYYNGQASQQNGYNDQYPQEPQRDNRYYEDARQRGPPPQQQRQPRQDYEQQYDQGYRNDLVPQQRRTNGTARPPPQHAHSYGAPSRQEERRQPAPVEVKQPKEHKRILKQQESPTTIPWDNPFGAFPTKKKQGEGRRQDGSDGRSDGVRSPESQPAISSGRPSTSHDNRPREDPPRPHTSHGQRQQAPRYHDPQDRERSRVRNAPPHSPDRSFQEQGMSYPPQRVAPQRAMTGPSPQDIPYNGPPPPQQRDAVGMPIREPLRQQNQHDYPQQVDNEFTRQLNGYPRHQNQNGYASQQNQPHLSQQNRNDIPRQPDGHPRPQDQNGYTQQQSYGDNSRQPAQNGYLQQNYEEASRQQGRVDPPPHVRPSNAPIPVSQANYQHDATPAGRQQSLENRHRQAKDERSPEKFDPSTYRGIPIRKKASPEVPNFDGMTPATNQRLEDQLVPDSAYRKPTYQAAGNSRPHVNPDIQAQAYQNELSSPLAQFSFGIAELPGSQIPAQPDFQSPMPPIRQDYRRDHPQQYQERPQEPQQVYQREPPSASQFPPRSASRADERAPIPRNGYDQMVPLPRPSHGPAQPSYEQALPPNNASMPNLAYNSTGRANYPDRVEQAPMNAPARPQLQNGPERESQRSGYDPRLRPESNPSPPQAYQQQPARPQTSNTNRRPSGGGYDNRASVETFRSNMTGPGNPESLAARPVPFRPGLMQSAPTPLPAPVHAPVAAPPVSNVQPVPIQRAPTEPQDAQPTSGPVTVQELNALRESFKASPNNHALGLKFAKRLVDAAKVLATENGKADPKQTAKNRERYVLDAHKVVKRLISAGYPEAMFYMADCYGQGLLGLQPDPKEAFSLYQSAAKAGHAQGAYRVAVCCELGAEDGGGTRRDPLKAVQWYRRAATLGDTPAMYKMGMIQLKGLLGQPKSPREAITWLKRAAERADAENPHALHELGLLYESALPTDMIVRDEKYALQLFIQAADLGYKYSQFRLGSAYEYGLLGCSIDPRRSIAWYSRAASQGEHQSEFALSGWYLTGSGQPAPGERPLLEQDDTEAYLWARKAAISGLTKAEYAMGYYTEVGIGVAANIEEAKKWYFRAAAQSHPKARERLEDLKKGGARMQKTRVSRSNVDKSNEGECNVM